MRMASEFTSSHNEIHLEIQKAKKNAFSCENQKGAFFQKRRLFQNSWFYHFITNDGNACHAARHANLLEKNTYVHANVHGKTRITCKILLSRMPNMTRWTCMHEPTCSHYHVLSCPTLSYHVLSCPTLSYHVLSHPIASCAPPSPHPGHLLILFDIGMGMTRSESQLQLNFEFLLRHGHAFVWLEVRRGKQYKDLTNLSSTIIVGFITSHTYTG